MEKSGSAEGNRHALSGLAQTYSSHGKSVSWGDQVCFMFQLELCTFSLLILFYVNYFLFK